MPPADPALNYGDFKAVCSAFARTVLTVDTATDKDPDDAYRRAGAYLTYERYNALAQQPRTRTSPTWEAWKQHQVRTQVSIAPFAGDSSGLQGQRIHSVLADSTPVGRDGWRGDTEHHAVHCALNSQDGQWRVATYDVEDLPA